MGAINLVDEMKRSIINSLIIHALSCGMFDRTYSWASKELKISNYAAAHSTTTSKVKGSKATKGKRHASLKSRSNKRKAKL